MERFRASRIWSSILTVVPILLKATVLPFNFLIARFNGFEETPTITDGYFRDHRGSRLGVRVANSTVVSIRNVQFAFAPVD